MKRMKDTEAGPWIVRFLRGHVRLWFAIVLGVVVYILEMAGVAGLAGLAGVPRFLISWDLGVVFYLATLIIMMARASPSDIRYHSAMQDEGAYGLLLLASAAAVVSFGAIFADLAVIDRNKPGYALEVALSITTVILSWTFIHAILALHYAHDYYGSGKHARGLKFPGDEPPDYWDFVYFAFVIGMTFQVSDVAVTNKGIRRLVVAHGMLAFLFTVAIVAITVNIASTLIGR